MQHHWQKRAFSPATWLAAWGVLGILAAMANPAKAASAKAASAEKAEVKTGPIAPEEWLRASTEPLPWLETRTRPAC